MNASSSQDTADQEPGQAPAETPVGRRMCSPLLTAEEREREREAIEGRDAYERA